MNHVIETCQNPELHVAGNPIRVFLNLCEKLHADQIGPGRVKAFDKLDGSRFRLRLHLQIVDELAERLIGIAFAPFDVPGHLLPTRPEVIALFHDVARGTPVVTLERTCNEVLRSDDLPDLAGLAMQKLCTELDWNRK